MGIEELKIIADIMGGLESTGLTGFLWFMGYKVASMLLLFVLLAGIAYGVYVLINKAINTSRGEERLRAIGASVDATFFGDCNHDDYENILAAIARNHEYKGESRAQKERVRDYQSRLGQLSEDYEALWQEHELAKETMARQTKMIRKLDESINDKFDKEENNEKDMATK
jgi:hypothetical protein